MQLTGAQFYQLLQTRPQTITWSAPPRSVTIRKTPSGSLGLKIKPFQSELSPGLESTTIVFEIQPECSVQESSLLAQFDRIVSVDGKLIVNLSVREVYSLFKSHKKDKITLGLCKVKRLPSENPVLRLQGALISHNLTNSSLQRLHSRTSSDSGRGSSPRSGGTNGSFVFDYGLQEIPSANSSVTSSCSERTHSLDETIAGSKQNISVKRSASGSSSTCSQACSQYGQRKRFSSKQQTVCPGRNGNLCHSGPCSLNLTQTSVPAHLVNPGIFQRELHCQHATNEEYATGTSSVPEGYTLSGLSDLQLFETRDRAQSLPLSCQVGTPSFLLEHTCNCQSHSSVNNLSDMAFDLGQSNKGIPVGNKCSSKVLPTKGQKGACSGCLNIAQQILTDPQNVRWDPNTKVINLERSNKKTPLGITFKVRQCQNEDESVDVYTLVKHVTKGGLADGKLMVGDWIRSVDGNPLHQAKEALGITKLLERRESMRFVIQRPVDMKGRNITSEEKGRKHYNYTPSTSGPSGVLPVPLDSTTLCGLCNNHSACPQEQSSSATGANLQTVNKPPKVERYFSSSSHSSNGSGRRHSPRTPPACNGTNQISNSYLRSVSMVHEHTDWLNMAKNMSSVHENVKFPSLQLFIAGSHALKMTELLFRATTCSNKHPLCMAGKDKFLHIHCFVSEESDGVTRLHLQEDVSISENELLNSVISQSLDTQISVCEEDIELDVATQFGSDPNSRCYSRLTSRSQNSNRCNGIVALDIFVVIDEKFFCQCCHVLFSKNSLFFLTFDGAKVLENTSEMARIGQMVHSSRAASGLDTPLYLFGFLDGESAENQSTKADELKALFYTDHGRQILRYANVVMPQFIMLQPPGVTDEDQGYRARQLIGQIVLHQEYLVGQLHLLTVSAMSWVFQQRHTGRYALQMSELKDGIISMLPDIQECQLAVITRELQASGIIRVSDDDQYCNNTSEDQLVLIKPTHFLMCLQALLSAVEKAAGNVRTSPRKHTVVQCPAATAENLLKTCFETSDFPNMAVKHLFSILENFAVVQKMWTDPDTYLLPYFCADYQNESDSSENKEEFVIYIELERVIGTGVFFRFVNNLGQLCKAVELSSLSLQSAEFTTEEWTICIQHLWKEDLIKFSLRSTKVNFPRSPPRGFVNNLIQTCKNVLPSSTEFHVSVACPLGEECQTDKGPQPHLIDILQESIFCGNVRVDAKKCVKMWQASCSLKDHQPNSKSTSHGAGDPPEDPHRPPEKKFDWLTPILHLDYSLLHNLFLQLRVHMPLGNDWTGFAACIGKTALEVALYETQKNPPEELIKDWARTNRATVRDLVNVLSEPNMERMDLVEFIKKTLNLS